MALKSGFTTLPTCPKEWYNTPGMKLRRPEFFVAGLGLLLLLAWGTIRLHGWISSEGAMRQFREAAEQPTPEPGLRQLPGDVPDTSLWAERRIRKYGESLRQDVGQAIAILSIPSIGLRVPVFEGTGAAVLNRGLGRIPGTAHPGEKGNLGIAGHRDGFFRALKDVTPGNLIVLETRKGRISYSISRIRIVEPSDVSVLRNRGVPELTLVTCYPFYFVGKAPKRYIVQAVLKEASGEISGASG